MIDSNPLQLMNDTTKMLMMISLKTAIYGNRYWVQKKIETTDVNYRILYNYAYLEGIENLLEKGLNILEIHPPVMEHHDCYLPDSYKRNSSMVGENIENILFDIKENGISLLRLTDIYSALTKPNLNDDKLLKELKANGLFPFFSCILKILEEELLLDEGFMPFKPLDNNETKKLRLSLIHHLQL